MAECNSCGGYLSIEDKIRLSMKCDANGNVVWQGALLNQGLKSIYINMYRTNESDYSKFTTGINDAIQITNDITVEAWIRTSVNTPIFTSILSRWRPYSNNRCWTLCIKSRKLVVAISNNGSSVGKLYTSNIDVATGEWVHVAFTFSSNELILYINGVVASVTKTTDNVVSELYTTIIPVRSFFDNSNTSYIGDLDEIRVWDYARNDNDIFKNYNKEINKNSSGLIAYYKLNEGFGTTATDLSVTKNDATLEKCNWVDNLNPINIILVAGQSNTDGRVATSDVNAPAYLADNIVDGVKVWNGTSIVNYDLTDIGQYGNGSSWITSQSSGRFSFAHVALKIISDNMTNVVVCQVTSGGTPLAAATNTNGSWNYNYDAIPDGTPALLSDLNNRFNNLITYLKTVNRKYNIIGMLWHQGEWDDDTQLDEEDEYEVNWQQLVSAVRSFTGISNLKIVYGTIPATSPAYSEIIRNAQLGFADNDINAVCRDNNDLTRFDTYHFDALSCILFGEWAADQIL